jgi:hypothetical protein
MSILNQQKIEKIFQSQEDISFKKYFETNLNTLPLRSILPKEKLTLDLIQQIDEKTFSKYYINLKIHIKHILAVLKRSYSGLKHHW